MESKKESLPIYLAPIPSYIEDLFFKYVWLVIAINVGGSIFGFLYYRSQLIQTNIFMWPIIPDSPMATLFIVISLLGIKFNYTIESVNMLAFFGCIKYGLWTPYILLIFRSDFQYLNPIMYNFLFWSHLSMAMQGFVIYRYSDFPIKAILIASIWYTLNDVLDYFLYFLGGPHHTYIPSEIINGVNHSVPGHDIAALGAILLTILLILLAFLIKIEKIKLKR